VAVVVAVGDEAEGKRQAVKNRAAAGTPDDSA